MAISTLITFKAGKAEGNLTLDESDVYKNLETLDCVLVTFSLFVGDNSQLGP